jgi:hypothetical protein
MDYQRRLNREMKARRTAAGLGWFSIALGLTEIFCARPLARSLGMKGQEGLLRLYGVREIATGIGIFATARNPAPFVWARVAGDAIDIATLAANVSGNPRKAQIALALANVAGVTAVDAATARALSAIRREARKPVRDYSDRSGYGRPLEEIRGIARKDFKMPNDMRIPGALRPRVH